jgi:hypothetical protein
LATPQGIYVFDGQTIKPTNFTDFTFSLTSDNDLLFAGQNSKIIVLQPQGNQLKQIDVISKLPDNIIKIAKKGSAIYAENSEGILFEIQSDTKKIIQLSNLKEYISLHINNFNGQIIFSSEKGLFYKKSNVDTLLPFELINKNVSSSKIWMYDILKSMIICMFLTMVVEEIYLF